MQHPTFSATLAEQHRDELRCQADQIRLIRGNHPNGRRRRPSPRRWWRRANRPAQA
jgi:hypothetical protein